MKKLSGISHLALLASTLKTTIIDAGLPTSKDGRVKMRAMLAGHIDHLGTIVTAHKQSPDAGIISDDDRALLLQKFGEATQKIYFSRQQGMTLDEIAQKSPLYAKVVSLLRVTNGHDRVASQGRTTQHRSEQTQRPATGDGHL